MAKTFLTPINMKQNEIQNAVMQPLAAPPMNPKEGQYYYDSTEKRMYQFNGERWYSNGIKYELELVEATETTVKIKIVGDGGNDGSSLLQGYISELELPIATAEQAGLLTAEAFSKIPTGGIALSNGLGTDGSTYMVINLIDSNNVKISSTRLGFGAGLKYTTNTGDNVLDGKLSIITDDEITDDSENIPTSGAVKAYLDGAIANLPADQFLDLSKTTYVDNFTWSATTYPNSTNPNLDGKPVLVLALKDNDGNTQYGFVSLNDLVDVYTGTAPINVSGGKITHANSGASAGSYGDSAAQTPAFGGKFKVLYATVNATGHITGISAHDVTIPNAVASTSANGLMAAADKTKLNKVTTNTYIKTGSIAAGQTSATISLTASADKVIAVNTYLSGEHVECDWSVSGANITVSIAQAVSSAVSIEVFAMTTL